MDEYNVSDIMGKVESQSIVDKLIAKAQESAANQLDFFFHEMENHNLSYYHWTGQTPKTLVVNPEIIGHLSRIEGFYQREELRALVPAYAPVVRNIRLSHGVVFIQEDIDEPFYHFE